jgi:hypothetical protein
MHQVLKTGPLCPPRGEDFIVLPLVYQAARRHLPCASYFYLQLTFVTDETPFHFLKLTKDKSIITYMTFACDSEVVMASASDILISLGA